MRFFGGFVCMSVGVHRIGVFWEKMCKLGTLILVTWGRGRKICENWKSGFKKLGGVSYQCGK